jgi:hypothetical protein
MRQRKICLLPGLLMLFMLPGFAHDAGRYDPLPCQPGQVQIMVLGTYHMSNPGLDASNMEADDVLSERRQAEIADLVNRLARFRPDQVLVEGPYGDEGIRRRYEAFLADQHELSRNETEQIGYRLARQLGLDSVAPIDYPMFQDDTALGFFKAYNPKLEDDSETIRAGWNAASTASAEKLRSNTIAEYLHHLNGSDYWAFGLDSRYTLQTSIRYAQYDQYAGADLLTSWYKRNLRMMTNIHRSLDDNDERALLLVGSGHNKILWELIDTSPLLCRVDPRPLLID